MTKFNLPKDLIKYRKKKIIIKISAYIILTTFFVFLLYFHGDKIFPLRYEKEPLKYIFYFLTMLLPMAITGVPFELIDKNWQGEIIKVHVNYTLRSEAPLWFVLFPHNDIIITVKRDDGKIQKIKVLTVGGSSIFTGDWFVRVNSKYHGKIEHHLKDYEVGDRVLHFYGFKKLFLVKPNQVDRSKYCIICATNNNIQEKTCLACGHELLSFEDFE